MVHTGCIQSQSEHFELCQNAAMFGAKPQQLGPCCLVSSLLLKDYWSAQRSRPTLRLFTSLIPTYCLRRRSFISLQNLAEIHKAQRDELLVPVRVTLASEQKAQRLCGFSSFVTMKSIGRLSSGCGTCHRSTKNKMFTQSRTAAVEQRLRWVRGANEKLRVLCADFLSSTRVLALSEFPALIAPAALESAMSLLLAFQLFVHSNVETIFLMQALNV